MLFLFFFFTVHHWFIVHCSILLLLLLLCSAIPTPSDDAASRAGGVGAAASSHDGGAGVDGGVDCVGVGGVVCSGRERRAAARARAALLECQARRALWAPKENNEATEDPFKTLFVARLVCFFIIECLCRSNIVLFLMLMIFLLRITKRQSTSSGGSLKFLDPLNKFFFFFFF